MLPPEEELLSDQDLREASIEQLANLRDRVNLALYSTAYSSDTIPDLSALLLANFNLNRSDEDLGGNSGMPSPSRPGTTETFYGVH